MVHKIHQEQKPSLSTVLAWSTVVVREGLLPADFNGRQSSYIPKSVTLAHVILRLRVAREIIGFLSVTDTYTYIHTNYFRDATQKLVASR